MKESLTKILNSNESNPTEMRKLEDCLAKFLDNRQNPKCVLALEDLEEIKLLSDDLDQRMLKKKVEKQFCINFIDEDTKPSGSNFLESFENSYLCRTGDEELYLQPRGRITRKGGNDLLPSTQLIGAESVPKFELETLFAMFYLDTDNYLRFLAACELKKRDWRFNKKFLVWFKRHSSPKEMNQEYEKGDFLVFDCEDQWAIKKKNDFKFEYKNLESDFE